MFSLFKMNNKSTISFTFEGYLVLIIREAKRYIFCVWSPLFIVLPSHQQSQITVQCWTTARESPLSGQRPSPRRALSAPNRSCRGFSHFASCNLLTASLTRLFRTVEPYLRRYSINNSSRWVATPK